MNECKVPIGLTILNPIDIIIVFEFIACGKMINNTLFHNILFQQLCTTNLFDVVVLML